MRLHPSLLFAFVLFSHAVGAAIDMSNPRVGSGENQSEMQSKLDRIIVTLSGPKAGRTSARPTRVALDISCDVPLAESFSAVKYCPKTDTAIIQLRRAVDQETLATALACLAVYLDEDPDQIEIDSRVSILEEPLYRQWHLSAISAQGSAGQNAWDFTRGSDDVIVAIIDTGVDYTHPDLGPNMWTNTGASQADTTVRRRSIGPLDEIPFNGIDDDNNGYVDDVHGYDFVNEDPDPNDDNGHGTHCAGIVGGAANVQQRVTGISPHVRVMALKAIAGDGTGRLSDIIAAVEYSLDMGAQITSNSFGSPDITRSYAFDRLLSALEDAQQLYVAAAGNTRTARVAFPRDLCLGRDADREPEFPASLDSPIILSVAATKQDDSLADFSNYGAKSIDLGAPGVDILSTQRKFGYRTAQGTSTATPLVAATAALVLSTLAKSTNTTHGEGLAVKEVILNSVDPVPALKDKTLTGASLDSGRFGGVWGVGGRLNALRAVATAGNYTCCDDTSGAGFPRPAQWLYVLALLGLLGLYGSQIR